MNACLSVCSDRVHRVSESHWSLFMRRSVGPCGSRIRLILHVFSIRLTPVIVFKLRTSLAYSRKCGRARVIFL